MGEIILITVVALLVLGPEKLPEAAKMIGKGIRDLRKQTRELRNTIEEDTHLGDAVREIRTALHGDPESLYKSATGEDFFDDTFSKKTLDPQSPDHSNLKKRTNTDPKSPEEQKENIAQDHQKAEEIAPSPEPQEVVGEKHRKKPERPAKRKETDPKKLQAMKQSVLEQYDLKYEIHPSLRDDKETSQDTSAEKKPEDNDSEEPILKVPKSAVFRDPKDIGDQDPGQGSNHE